MKRKGRSQRTLQKLLSAISLVALVSMQTFPVSCTFAAESSAHTLTPGAREAATLLGILPKVERLIRLEQSRFGQDATTLSDEELALKVDVLDKVMGGSLEIRMETGRINRELTWAFGGQNMLQAKQQRNLNYLFAANFLQNGVLGILAGGVALNNYPVASNELLLVASSVGLGLSAMSLVETARGSKPIDGGTTVLADVFHLNHPEPLHRADLVIKFLNSVPPLSTDGKTRIETLMNGWKKSHYLRTTNEKQLQKLSALVPPGQKYRENTHILSNRIRMLFDTQTAIQELDADLLDILRAVNIN